jgi:hypothetical protein
VWAQGPAKADQRETRSGFPGTAGVCMGPGPEQQPRLLGWGSYVVQKERRQGWGSASPLLQPWDTEKI